MVDVVGGSGGVDSVENLLAVVGCSGKGKALVGRVGDNRQL